MFLTFLTLMLKILPQFRMKSGSNSSCDFFRDVVILSIVATVHLKKGYLTIKKT